MTHIHRILRRVPKKVQAGFTLVEMLVAMGLMSIFLVVLSDIVVAVADVRTESEAVASVSQDGRHLLARLSYDIQRATSVTTPAALGASSPTLVLVIGGVSHTYSLSGGNLRLAVSPNTDNLNSSETTISAFTVQRYGNIGGKETLTVNFTVTSKALRDSGVETKTFTTTVGRR